MEPDHVGFHVPVTAHNPRDSSDLAEVVLETFEQLGVLSVRLWVLHIGAIHAQEIYLCVSGPQYGSRCGPGWGRLPEDGGWSPD